MQISLIYFVKCHSWKSRNCVLNPPIYSWNPPNNVLEFVVYFPYMWENESYTLLKFNRKLKKRIAAMLWPEKRPLSGK